MALSMPVRAQEALGADVVGHDASGNPILKDIGTYLRDNIKKHIKARAFHTLPVVLILSIETSSRPSQYLGGSIPVLALVPYGFLW